MHYRKVGLIALIPLTAVSSQLVANFSAPLQRQQQVLAQTMDARKAEAEQLIQQGIQYAQTSQFESVLQHQSSDW